MPTRASWSRTNVIVRSRPGWPAWVSTVNRIGLPAASSTVPSPLRSRRPIDPSSARALSPSKGVFGAAGENHTPWPGEVLPGRTFYDYEAKYAPGGSTHILPAKISPFVYQEVRRLTVAAHRALGCRGVSRADFRWDDTAEGTEGLFCLEVNTQPGMTETSLVPELAAHAGLSFAELVQWMVEDASLNR